MKKNLLEVTVIAMLREFHLKADLQVTPSACCVMVLVFEANWSWLKS